MDKKTRESLLEQYNPPQWMKKLKNIPTHRIKAAKSITLYTLAPRQDILEEILHELGAVPQSQVTSSPAKSRYIPISMAIENTPIHRWYLPGVPEGYEIYIKRDDLTGCALSGNKVRSLEFLFGEVVEQGFTSICSTGPVQSNFLRTMALMASRIGMKTYFVIHGNKDQKTGNDLLSSIVGANRYLVPTIKGTDFESRLYPIVSKLAEKVRNDLGENPYTYFFGNGSYPFGYLHVFEEMLRQDVQSFSDIVACGSSGSTVFGLALGNHLNHCNIKIHNLQCGEQTQWCYDEINKMLRYVGVQEQDGSGLTTNDLVEITECHGAGYKVNTQEEIDFIKEVAAQTGIILGHTYSGKAAYNMMKRLNEKPDVYKGKKILFVHTGGIFENFDGRLENAFDNDDNINQWAKDL